MDGAHETPNSSRLTRPSNTAAHPAVVADFDYYPNSIAPRMLQGVRDERGTDFCRWGPELADFLDQFADCFGRSEPRCHMAQYV